MEIINPQNKIDIHEQKNINDNSNIYKNNVYTFLARTELMETKNGTKIPKYLKNGNSNEKNNILTHIETGLVKNGNNLSHRTVKIYNCCRCNYKSSNKKDYNKHLLTLKHAKNTHMVCENCNKQYKSRSGLWKHQQKCIEFDNSLINENNEIVDDDINEQTNNYVNNNILDILKQNQEFKQLMLEQTKQIQIKQDETTKLYKQNEQLHQQLIDVVKYNSGNNIQNQIIHNNQKFNLNFFLNTTCKDAMNMSEFIKDINIDFKDIENIGKQGYISGMTDMILSRIKNLDITKRPLHCTDIKRETMYIKDNDEWSKDTPENTKLRNMITIVSKQNYNTLPIWREYYPECNKGDHPRYELCLDMMRNIIGDVGEKQAQLDNKVIKNIAKHILIK